MLRACLIVFFVVVVIAVGGALVLSAKSGEILTRLARSEGIELSIRESSLSYFPPHLRLLGVGLKQGRPELSAIRVQADALEIPFSLLPLLRGRVHVGALVARAPRVELVEGDEHSVKKESKPLFLRVESATIEAGEFTYRRLYKGGDAVIRVREINGSLGKLDSQSSEVTVGAVTAKLENSGAVALRVEAAYFAPVPNVKFSLEIKDQNMAELNSFFTRSDGLKLFGQLVLGRADVSLRDKRVRATVRAKYTGFDLNAKKHRERSGLEAFFINLFRSIKIDDQNLNEARKDQEHSVQTNRQPKESVVSALIRGMKLALLYIATT